MPRFSFLVSRLSGEIQYHIWKTWLGSFLCKWKRSWFVLYRNGELMYYDSPDSNKPKDRKVLYAVCTGIFTGEHDCTYSPPEGVPPACLLMLKIKTVTGDHEVKWKLCAESPDDLCAWKLVLEEARSYNPFLQPSQQSYQHTIHTGAAGDIQANGPQHVNIVVQAGPTQVLGLEDYAEPRRYYGRYGYRRPAPPPFSGAVLSPRR